jgi:putative Holliday junction resolvase
MRTLAIDLGTKRIGLALSDEGGRFATPHSVLQVSSPERAIDPILQLIEREGVQRLVVGLPLNMDGTLGAQARQVINWSRNLQKRGTLLLSGAKSKGVPLFFVDERLSSFDAEQQIIERKRKGEKITRKSKREQLDAIVASTLLQEFLDGKLMPLDVT